VHGLLAVRIEERFTSDLFNLATSQRELVTFTADVLRLDKEAFVARHAAATRH
jgi:hypothetical protein